MTDLKPITHRDFSHPWSGFDSGNLIAVFGVNVMVALVMTVTHYMGAPKEASSFVIAHIVTTILTFTWLAGLTARDNRRASYRKYLQGQALFDLRAAQECPPQVYAGENLTLIQEAIEEKESIIALQREAAALQAAPRHQNARSSYSQKHSSENGMSTDAVLTTSAGHSSSSSSYCDSGSSSSCGGGGDGGGGGGF